MRLRSLLFVPADSERKFAKASAGDADALILDLEDSVTRDRKATARGMMHELIGALPPHRWSCWVRVNSLDTGLTLQDLAAIVQPGLDGIVVPKGNGVADVLQLGHYLEALETRAGMPAGQVKILVIATETPTATFGLGSYTPAPPRLAGLTWGAEDLGAAVGAVSNRETDGSWTTPYQLARSLCLFGATSAGVAPIDTVYTDFRDTAGLAASCRIARRDGFTGCLAIHPDQVAPINASFTPTAEEIEHARRVIAAFAAAPDSGTVAIDGEMYDLPHLKQAHRIVVAAAADAD